MKGADDAASMTLLAKRLCEIAGVLMFAGGALAALIYLVDGYQRGSIDWFIVASAAALSLSAGPVLALAAVIGLLERLVAKSGGIETRPASSRPAPEPPGPSGLSDMWKRSGQPH